MEAYERIGGIAHVGMGEGERDKKCSWQRRYIEKLRSKKEHRECERILELEAYR